MIFMRFLFPCCHFTGATSTAPVFAFLWHFSSHDPLVKAGATAARYLRSGLKRHKAAQHQLAAWSFRASPMLRINDL
jgi:hypothetical protein